jgi:lysophospholipase L1-like esterase
MVRQPSVPVVPERAALDVSWRSPPPVNSSTRRVSAILVRRILPVVSASAFAALLVPIVQAIVMWRTLQPEIPGPHHQDGELPGPSGATDAVRVVWLGDSLASGMGAQSADSSFPRRAVAHWHEAEGRPITLTCLAREGSTSADVLAEQVPAAVAELGPGSVAVVTVGSNDVGSCTGPRRFARDYAAILGALRATGAEVIAVGLPDLGSAVVIPHPLRALARGVGRRADRAIRSIAAAHDAHFVSIDNRAPRRTEPSTYLAADRYHPNDETYALWAAAVSERLSPLLRLAAP